jgi:hypothetical protein
VSRYVRLAIVAVVGALAPVLAGCDSGTSAATNTEHTVENGIQTSQGTVEVRDAYLALAGGGSVSLHAAFYNTGSAPDLLESVSPAAGAGTFSVRVPAQGLVIPSENGVDSGLVLLESNQRALPVTGLGSNVQIGDEVAVVFTFRDEPPIRLVLQVESPTGQAPITNPGSSRGAEPLPTTSPSL